MRSGHDPYQEVKAEGPWPHSRARITWARRDPKAPSPLLIEFQPTSYGSTQFGWTHNELFWHPSSGKLLYGGVRIAWLGATILVASFELALSEQFSGTPAEACLAVNRNLSLGAQLPRTAARLESIGERLLIVAIGSSSTVGLWVLRSAATYPEVMRQELVRLADVILMDLQYAPMVLASPYYSSMEAIISEVAREEKVGLFSRFTLMRKSIEAGVSPSALVSWDGLHNTADGYDCIGRGLARGRFKFGSVRSAASHRPTHQKTETMTFEYFCFAG